MSLLRMGLSLAGLAFQGLHPMATPTFECEFAKAFIVELAEADLGLLEISLAHHGDVFGPGGAVYSESRLAGWQEDMGGGYFGARSQRDHEYGVGARMAISHIEREPVSIKKRTGFGTQLLTDRQKQRRNWLRKK